MVKIYNKVIIDISTGKIISEDLFEYTGPIMACKGGGSSTTSIDKEYNAGMLALSQEQQDWAREMFGVFKGGMGGEGDTSEMQYMQNIINANQGLLGDRTELERSQLKDAMAGIKERAPVRAKFFSEALEGVDVNERMGFAQADVAQGFASAEGTARRNAAKMGRNPANINFGDMATDRAKAIGFAKTKARTGAEDDNWNRLRSAMAMG